MKLFAAVTMCATAAFATACVTKKPSSSLHNVQASVKISCTQENAGFTPWEMLLNLDKVMATSGEITTVRGEMVPAVRNAAVKYTTLESNPPKDKYEISFADGEKVTVTMKSDGSEGSASWQRADETIELVCTRSASGNDSAPNAPYKISCTQENAGLTPWEMLLNLDKVMATSGEITTVRGEMVPAVRNAAVKYTTLESNPPKDKYEISFADGEKISVTMKHDGSEGSASWQRSDETIALSCKKN